MHASTKCVLLAACLGGGRARWYTRLGHSGNGRAYRGRTIRTTQSARVSTRERMISKIDPGQSSRFSANNESVVGYAHQTLNRRRVVGAS
jgi:hypothetical protein